MGWGRIVWGQREEQYVSHGFAESGMQFPLPSPVTAASAARDVERPASVDRVARPPTSALLALGGDQITLFLSPFVSHLSLVIPFISLPNPLSSPLPSFLCSLLLVLSSSRSLEGLAVGLKFS